MKTHENPWKHGGINDKTTNFVTGKIWIFFHQQYKFGFLNMFGRILGGFLKFEFESDGQFLSEKKSRSREDI